MQPKISKATADEADVFLRVFGSEDGSRVLSILKTKFDCQDTWPTDPIHMAQLVGRQSVYKWITGVFRMARAVKRGDVEITEDDIDVRFDFRQHDRRE